MLKKINAVLSLLSTIQYIYHTLFFLLFKVGALTCRPGMPLAWVFLGTLAAHAILSLYLVFRNKPATKAYPKQNIDTIKQRLSGFLIVILSTIHIITSLNGTSRGIKSGAGLLSSIIFFILGLVLLTFMSMHMGISVEKAFITLKIGRTERACKTIKIVSEIIIIPTFITSIVLMIFKYFVV